MVFDNDATDVLVTSVIDVTEVPMVDETVTLVVRKVLESTVLKGIVTRVVIDVLEATVVKGTVTLVVAARGVLKATSVEG